MGLLRLDDSQEIRDTFVMMMEVIGTPFRSDNFRWENCGMMKQIHGKSLKFGFATKFRPPPPDIIFLNRRIAGTQLILEKLGPTLNPPSIVEKYL